ncbi:hypothetical protein AVEN_41062-1 [Araneus ventricosus]|uniref:Uncharacterized protein n=1 Tax=Araneus ventricosus TaxID=182803 RepID=A0A4Y2CLQ7_ARAVE|nr:hypothetical protein AVEN_41062-1 [Araneus ventricosus]
MKPSDDRCNISSAEAEVLMGTTGNGPILPVGGTHYHQEAPTIIVPTREARPRLLIRRLLIHVLVVPPQWDQEK